MKLTKGKITKLYNKRKQSFKRFKKNKNGKPMKSKTFRKKNRNYNNIHNISLKKYNGGLPRLSNMFHRTSTKTPDNSHVGPHTTTEPGAHPTTETGDPPTTETVDPPTTTETGAHTTTTETGVLPTTEPVTKTPPITTETEQQKEYL